MTDRTPKRATNSDTGFSPIKLHESPAVSPQKNLTGLPRLVKDLAADVYNNIQHWNDLHIKGCSLVKEIALIKSDNPNDFSSILENIVNKLFVIVQSLRLHKDVLLSLVKQIRASEKMQRVSEPIFISLDAKSLANLVEYIAIAYEDEFKLKEFVLENIPYAKNKDDAMFMAAMWTYQTKITNSVGFKLEVLLTETGHRKIQ